MTQMAKARMKPLPSCFMTKIEGYPDRDSAKGGMASFSGSGPAGKTCGSCQHCIDTKGASRCSEFKRLTGRRGETIEKKYAACKYFTQKLRQSKGPDR